MTLTWSYYDDGRQICRIPLHVVVTSEDYDVYLALVCRTQMHLVRERNRGQLYASQYKHLITDNTRFGQQTTFPVRCTPSVTEGKPYDVEFTARIQRPYCVRLCGSRPLTAREVERLHKINEPDAMVEHWLTLAEQIRSKDKLPHNML